MFENLTSRLTTVFTGLRKRGIVTEEDIETVMREVRVALLEADVALPVVKNFVASLKEKALGAEIVRSVSPAQMVIKLVYDHLVELLGSTNSALNLAANPPVVIMMVGLQGSGKTTSSGKLALLLKTKQNKRVLLASLDVHRPAAQHQLEVLAGQAGVGSLPIVAGEQPVTIAERAVKTAKLEGYDVLILDTAGRLHVDEALMQELETVKRVANPLETLLVADALTGQDAVNIAKAFHERIGVTGNILTRVDGDGRGGAALSMRTVTGQPIKFVGVGEKLTEFEAFHPERVASRILDMGDVVSLVERAAETVSQEDAEKMAARLEEGKFDFNDMASQFKQMRKMGGIGGLLGMLPGISGLKDKLSEANIDERMLVRQEAIIQSMTPNERKHPKLLNGSRKIRIAKGAGMTVQDVNRLFKQYQQMETMMKRMKKLGKKGMLRSGLKNLMPM